MRISEINVRNFRLLKDVSLSLEEKSTIIVGRNNSGKTSLTEIFRRLLSDRSPIFSLHDFSSSCIKDFKVALLKKAENADLSVLRNILPFIELKIKVKYSSDEVLGALADFIIDVDLTCDEAIIVIQYRLEDGKIPHLFDGINDIGNLTDAQFNKLLKERVPKYYSTEVYAQDPNDEQNIVSIPVSTLKELIGVGFINAQRGLDDVTQTEKDFLGKTLSRIFKSASQESAPMEVRKMSDEIRDIVASMQETVDTEFCEKLNKLMPALKMFGYPGLSDSNISTETTLNIDNILESNTKIRYDQGTGIHLPETYNGLGSRNLIYILFQLFEFFRNWQASYVSSGMYLIFIEEPEAHLHPQMQQIFVKRINEIVKEFSQNLNGGHLWPVQFIITTHATHIANEAPFESIRYFLTRKESLNQTKVKDLRKEFSDTNRIEDKEFLHKYLTLTKCDLFFSDKCLLIEGPTERILMPKIIEKIDSETNPENPLGSQFISVIEVGGAYMHHFYKFLDFLELQSLVITDIDSVRQTHGKKGIVYKGCLVSRCSHSSNAGIKNWYGNTNTGYISLSEVVSKKEEDKIVGLRRIAYQVAQDGNGCCGRSFEDAFMLANVELFGLEEFTGEALSEAAFLKTEDIEKTNFAMKYALEVTDWKVPTYLKQGIIWLTENVGRDTKIPVVIELGAQDSGAENIVDMVSAEGITSVEDENGSKN